MSLCFLPLVFQVCCADGLKEKIAKSTLMTEDNDMKITLHVSMELITTHVFA